ncbi:MAG TPA: sulfotransferase [Chitinophagales bacterium]|nr:sulfotransferase [Chitinophagales bacterium]
MAVVEQEKIIFIVGNSRSGTTMMRRVLGNHPDVFMLEELHFFEQLWSTQDKQKVLTQDEAALLASKLVFIQRDGYLTAMQTDKYLAEAHSIVQAIQEPLFPHIVLKGFLFHESALHGKSIPCEKTPQDVFYIGEILELFPHARIINMVRDPRGVLLSQKRKWQRKKMGAGFMTKKEQRRLRINYHPITISKLWNSSIRAAAKFKEHPKVHNVIFEQLVNASEQEVRDLCAFLDISFHPDMLRIPQVGSSNEADKPDAFGIKTERAGNWEKGGLNAAEVWFCQRICGDNMRMYGYEIKKMPASPLLILAYYISFPFKLVLAVLFNLHRMKNIVEAIKRRLS